MIKDEADTVFGIFFKEISAIIEMPAADRALCHRYFEALNVPKDTVLEKAGKVPQHQYFVVSGILRNYYLTDSGEEATIDMNNGPRFFTSYTHFINRTVSNENIVCLTDCSLLRIKRDDVDILYEQSGILQQYTILLLEKVFEQERSRIKELTALSAEQRYLAFLEQQPALAKHAPLQYIASYLGMKPETISRIRRKIIS